MGVVTLLLDSRTETTIRLTTSKNGKLIELNIEIRCFSTCENLLSSFTGFHVAIMLRNFNF
jgi:hypothetical protein